MVYSHWLSSGLGPALGPGRMGCMILCITLGPGREITGKNTNGCYTHFSGPENLPGDEL